MSKSKRSILPHWDGKTYTRYASGLYDWATSISGWRRNLKRVAFDDLPIGRFLDVGCGTGYLMSLARDFGFDVYGLDPSSGMLEQARKKYGFEDSRLREGSASQLPFEDSSFDVVLASGSLVHVPEIEAASKEMVRVLRPGGVIRIIDHAVPQGKRLFYPLVSLFSQLSGDILHDYEHSFGHFCKLTDRKTVGRGGYLQRFDFRKVYRS